MELLGILGRLGSVFGEGRGAEDPLDLNGLTRFTWSRVDVQLPLARVVWRVEPDPVPAVAQFAPFEPPDRLAIGGFQRHAVDGDIERQQQVFRPVVSGLFCDRGGEFGDFARVAGPQGELGPRLVDQRGRLAIRKVEAVEFVEAGS